MGLLVCREDQPVNLKALGAKVEGERLSFGRLERLMTYLGVIPGTISPFALINDLQPDINVTLDKDMFHLSPLKFHSIMNKRQ